MAETEAAGAPDDEWFSHMVHSSAERDVTRLFLDHLKKKDFQNFQEIFLNLDNTRQNESSHIAPKMTTHNQNQTLR